MGRRILAERPDLAQAASARLGLDLRGLCLEAEEGELQRTENAQPALLLVSLLLLEALAQAGIRAAAAAGHSLGEYGALVAAGSLQPLDALAVVRERGLAMAAAAPDGAMAAVLGLPETDVEWACHAAGGQVVPANYNAPGQVVISGEADAVERALHILQARGARRVVRLRVSGAFHSPLMAAAAGRLSRVLAAVPLQPPRIPVVFNVDAAIHQDAEAVRRLLVEQLTAPVRWSQVVEALWDQGVRRFVEVGPQRTLTGLIRRILPEAQLFNVEDVDSLKATVPRLQ